MTKTGMLRPQMAIARTATAVVPPKQADAELLTPEHRAWRLAVCERAGWRCEWVEDGVRCERAAPAYVMIADHIKERADGGARLASSNGQCLCVKHNTIKGLRARRRRQG